MAINQNRKTYDFNSVGQTSAKYRKDWKDPAANFPIGIRTPLRFGYGNDGVFKMSTDLATQVRDNFRNMIATNWGERLMLNDFGGNLAELAFEMGNEEGDLEAIARVQATIDKYMPFIKPSTFEPFNEASEIDTTGLTKIGVRISYTIEGLGTDLYQDEIIIYSAG